ncbi:glycerol dehydrogenase [Alcaligenaceae bacterium C4P045]|nr:glycerol dehydrogenase [Alcaligenaceae bacterium C4P045]
MDTGDIRAFGAAHRYYQGTGAVALIGECVASLGRHPVLVCDMIVRDLVHAGVVASCAAQSQSLRWLEVRGDVTRAAVAALCVAARAEGATPDVVIAAGGGKGVDTGKAVARELGARLVVLPTSASNDGPCSKAFVFYDDHHNLLSVEQLARNPDAVVVDTRFLVRAPRALLVSGIGDALCKLYEGDQTRLAGGRNLFGGVSTIAAEQLSVACDRVIRTDAEAALSALGTAEPNAAFERLTEALVLLSGLAFENSGLSIAHSMTRGLPRVPALGAALHGLQVAYGLYVQWQLEGRPEAFMAEQARFYRAIGLPRTLAELGASQVDDAMIASIAEGTMQSPHLKHFQRPLAQADFVAAMQRVEALSFSPA